MSGSQGFGQQSFGQGYGQFQPRPMQGWGGQQMGNSNQWKPDPGYGQQPQYSWNPTAEDTNKAAPAPLMGGIPGGPGWGAPQQEGMNGPGGTGGFNEGYNPYGPLGKAGYRLGG